MSKPYQCVILILLPVRSMRKGYAFGCVYMCVGVWLCVCVVKKHGRFASCRSEIATKTLSMACSLNLSPHEDVISAGKSCWSG